MTYVSALDELAAVAEADGLVVGFWFDPDKVTEALRWEARLSEREGAPHLRIRETASTAAEAADAALDAYRAHLNRGAPKGAER